MRPARFTPFNAVDASQNQTSVWFPVDQVLQMSVIAAITGTSTGTLTVYVSNQAASVSGLPLSTGITSSQSLTFTGAGQYLLPKFDICYQWVQFVYQKTNGAAGTLTVDVKTNGV